MKKAKLIFSTGSDGGVLLGSDVRLVDAETNEELKCITDIRILCPLKGVIAANVDITISEIEILPPAAGVQS
jgi:hypothetical protein